MHARPLSARWSTQDVEPKRALDYWVETVVRSLLELEIDSAQRDRFEASLDQADFGPSNLNLVEANTQKLNRTRGGISRSNHGFYFLLQLRAGRLQMRQYGREAYVQTNECILVDASEPFFMHFPEHSRCLALRFPQDWLRMWIPSPERFAATRLPAAAGWGAALSSTLMNLEAATCNRLALSGSTVCEQIAALLALACAPPGPASGTPKTLYERLLESAGDRSHEAELTPTVLAGEFGISKRYLHHLFAQHGTTFGEEIMNLRLDRARQLLGDRRFESVPIGDIAARCGFVEPSHFARRFRMKYGQAPARYRSAYLDVSSGGASA